MKEELKNQSGALQNQKRISSHQEVKEIGIQAKRELPAEHDIVDEAEVEQLRGTVRRLQEEIEGLNMAYQLNQRELHENNHWLNNQDNLIAGIKRLE